MSRVRVADEPPNKTHKRKFVSFLSLMLESLVMMEKYIVVTQVVKIKIKLLEKVVDVL